MIDARQAEAAMSSCPSLTYRFRTRQRHPHRTTRSFYEFWSGLDLLYTGTVGGFLNWADAWLRKPASFTKHAQLLRRTIAAKRLDLLVELDIYHELADSIQARHALV